MSEQEFDRAVDRIVGVVHGDPPAMAGGAATATSKMASSDASQLVARLQDRHAQLRSTAAALQVSLDSLRLSVKYLVFDLEATRRENESLKRQIAAGRDDFTGDQPSRGD